MGRVADDSSWQARAGEGCGKANVALNWERQVATCPLGKESVSWVPHGDAAKGEFQIRFRRGDGTPCLSRSPCTKAKQAPRRLLVQARPQLRLSRPALAAIPRLAGYTLGTLLVFAGVWYALLFALLVSGLVD